MKTNLDYYLEVAALELMQNYTPERSKQFEDRLKLLGIKSSGNGAILFESEESFECEHSETFKGFQGAHHKDYVTTETYGPGWVNGFFKGYDGQTTKSYSCYTSHSIGGDRFSSIYHSVKLGDREYFKLPFIIGAHVAVGKEDLYIPVPTDYMIQPAANSDQMFYELLAKKTMSEEILWESEEKLCVVGDVKNFTDKLKADLVEHFGIKTAVFHDKDCPEKKISLSLDSWNVYFFGGWFALSRYGMSELNHLLVCGYVNNTRNPENFYQELAFFKETFKNDRNILRYVEAFILEVNKKQKFQIKF